MSTCSDTSLLLLSEIKSPAVEKRDSAGQLVAGIARYLRTSGIKSFKYS